MAAAQACAATADGSDAATHPKRALLLPLKPQYLIAVLLLPALLAPVSADESVRFLPDDALIACRAIMPACFTKAGWAQLCEANPDLHLTHPVACRLAGEET